MLSHPFFWREKNKFFSNFIKNRHFIFTIFEPKEIGWKIQFYQSLLFIVMAKIEKSKSLESVITFGSIATHLQTGAKIKLHINIQQHSLRNWQKTIFSLGATNEILYLTLSLALVRLSKWQRRIIVIM